MGKCQLEHPDLQISTGILYRKWKAYLEHDLAGMLGIRGGSNKGSSEIPQLVWEAFLWFWLSENQPTVCASYRNTITWTEDFHPELVACIPSERSFRRRIDRDVAEATKILMREGEKAFSTAVCRTSCECTTSWSRTMSGSPTTTHWIFSHWTKTAPFTACI
ncbi:MAG: DNA-binding domain-containing protein [Ruminococcus sp.]